MNENPFWPSIRANLTAGSLHGVGRLMFITIIAPAVEGALINLWTGAYSAASTGLLDPAAVAEAAANGMISSAYLACLVLVVIFHGIVAIPVLYREWASSPQSILARAFLLYDEAISTASELQRRELTNELVRSAFERLNQQTCVIEYNPSASSWCIGGFHSGLEPIIEPFLDKVDLALGVRGGKYTLEVYFEPGIVPTLTQEEIGPNGLCQLAFYGTHKNRCDGVCMNPSHSPAKLGMNALKAYQKHVDEDRQLFFDGEQLKPMVYFRRYAPCPIHAPCSDDVIGVLVLTSMQDDPFASNVSETLAFLSTLISNYEAAYSRCFQLHRNRGLVTSSP